MRIVVQVRPPSLEVKRAIGYLRSLNVSPQQIIYSGSFPALVRSRIWKSLRNSVHFFPPSSDLKTLKNFVQPDSRMTTSLLAFWGWTDKLGMDSQPPILKRISQVRPALILLETP